MEDSDAENVMFVDTLFLRNFGVHEANVLDYFALSPFYDATSNNQLIRIQGASMDNLVNMQGIEYIVESLEKGKLFLIKKRQRSSPKMTKLLDIYYTVDLGEGYFVIYKTPDLLHVLRSRYQKLSLYLKRSFTQLLSDVEYRSTGGHDCFQRQIVEDLSKNDDGAIDDVPFIERRPKRPTVREFPSITSVIDDISSLS